VPNLSTHRQNPTLLSLGDTIRRLRRERGISQEALALLAEVDRSYVGRVERGDNNVAFLTLVKLAAALQITVTKLMKEAQL
jgi:transcriptional regulator with XRE-family HTH domain